LLDSRFFITSSVLDLTIVGLDTVDGDSMPVQQHHYLKTCSKPNLELGSAVYLLGYAAKQELTVGEGKLVIASDNLIKLSTDGVTWSPGSAGFDVHGNLAFMVCDPMKLATLPNTKSSTSSSSTSSWKKDSPMQFGIPIPIICDWLKQHWEGNLDELNKPKLPLIRLMSSGQKSEHSCASFTMRRIFKPTEGENEGTPSSSNVMSKHGEQPGPSYTAVTNTLEDEILTAVPRAGTHVQEVPTPEIYESPMLTSFPVGKRESNQIQLLDINFPPRIAKATVSAPPVRKMPSKYDENFVEETSLPQPLEEEQHGDRGLSDVMLDAESTGSVNGAQSNVQLCSSPVEFSEFQHEYSSEGETTMYSAETAESRLQDFKKLAGGEVVLRNNIACRVERLGNVTLKFENGYMYTLERVRIRDGLMNVINGSLVIFKGVKKNGIYVARAEIILENNTTISNIESDSTLKWYKRLPHVGEKGLTILHKKGVFEKCGVFLLKHKSETFEKFKSWKVLIENQMSTKIKILRTDNGLEFYNSEFDKLCESNGILRHKMGWLRE
ncbi:uncharacterized protein LOC111385817, partial [Olea europaea var. sylvestris]|uniref:uncharacterized protein LOC111385817 n=1 Tax=Olea europaea var. sylvestris TaxID=158386 RepID=UPI000C1D30E6